MQKLLLELPLRIETERLYLRCYQPGDGPWYYHMSQANQEHLQRYESENAVMSIQSVDGATVWLLMGFFEEFPQEIQEQAMVDGCSELGDLVKVILPTLAPGIVVVALFCITFAYNEFLFSVTLTRGNTKTLMVLLSSFLSPQRYNYGAVAGTAIIGIIPAFLLALFLQRYLVKGQAMGGLKG